MGTARAKRLFAEPDDAYDEGSAPLLLRALARPVVAALVAERAPAYLTILYGLARMRRAHELEPLHEDVFQHVATAVRAVEPDWDLDALGRDVEQLETWGCVERRVERLRIRGYRDNRRQRFRYRLTEDAVAMIEWLEARLVAAIEGRVRDSRDRLADIAGQLRELARVLEAWHRGGRDADSARRAVYLLEAVDEGVHAITEELLAFRAAMIAFASRPYDLETLRAILAWLERYVAVYVTRVEALREDIARQLDRLDRPRLRAALAECRAALETERANAPRALGGGAALRDPGALLDAQRPFFAEGGRLCELCRRIDDSGREVLRKMHRHVRELERRSARLEDLRARVRELASLPADAPPEKLARFVNAIVASGHGRFAGRRAIEGGTRAAPPAPRRQRSRGEGGPPLRPLRAKESSPEAVRALRARRLSELDRWLAEEVAPGGGPVRLSDVAPLGPDAPRRMMDVARARLLAHGRDLARAGWSLELHRDAGEVVLGAPSDRAEGEGLAAPDATIERRRT